MTKFDEFKARIPADMQDALLGELLAGWEQEQQATQQGQQFKAESDGGASETPAEEPPEAPAEESVFIGDMTPEEFGAFLMPLIQQAMGGMAEQAAQVEKAAQDAQQQTAAALQAATEELAQLKAQRDQAEQAHATTLDAIDQRIKALEGEQPRSVQRSSQAEATIVKGDTGDPPTPDPATQSSQELVRLSSWIVSP